MKKLPKRALVVLEIISLLLFVLLITLNSYMFLYKTMFWWIGFSLSLLIYVFLSFIFFPLYYNSNKYELLDDKIIFERGVFSNKKQIINLDKIVYISIIKTPFYYIFKICSLEIFVMGTKIKIPMLDNKTCINLSKKICPENEF